MDELVDQEHQTPIHPVGRSQTLPDDAEGVEIISVVSDKNDKFHVALLEVVDDAESWGFYLSDVARAMARDAATKVPQKLRRLRKDA
jgi:hypothetical protein